MAYLGGTTGVISAGNYLGEACGQTRRMSGQPPSADTWTFRERLLPGPTWWLVVAALVAMIAIAYGAALGTTIGMVVAVGVSVISVVGFVRASPHIEVSATSLRCGRAELPRQDIDDVRLVDRSELTTIRRGQDPCVGDRAYQVLPAWLGRSAVLVSLRGGQDPHTAWLIGTRRPQELAAALSTPA